MHADVGDRVEQVWFAGAHSNVGGGYPQQGMSLVALDWMMSKAEKQGLRFSTFERELYRGQQGFADKLYNPRSGLGIFYRWKPRNVTALCAEKGIAFPRIHASVIERIVQAPEGYAPGNVPPRCAVVTTEERLVSSTPSDSRRRSRSRTAGNRRARCSSSRPPGSASASRRTSRS